MKNIAVSREREFWILLTIVILSFLSFTLFPRKIDDGMVFFFQFGDFEFSFGLKQTIDYLIEVPAGWLSLKARFFLSCIFAFLALFFAFLLGKVFFEGRSPLRVSNLKYSGYLNASRYYNVGNIGDTCRFSVISGGEVFDLCGKKGDLLASRGLNESKNKVFYKAPGKKATLSVLGGEQDIKAFRQNSQEKKGSFGILKNAGTEATA